MSMTFQVQAVDDVRELICSGEGIESLIGIAGFYALNALDVSDNPIASVEPLIGLDQLFVLKARSIAAASLGPLSPIALERFRHIEQ